MIKLNPFLKYCFLFILISCESDAPILPAQNGPGNVFREYIWLPTMVNQGVKFLRVGGKLDYKTNSDLFPAHFHEDGYISFGKNVKLDHAIKAEVVLEKIESHDDTKGLRVSINRNLAKTMPPAQGIPNPESAYMHHTNPVVEIPLNQLNEGMDNTFRLDVNPDQRWNWPQNLIYGVILRIYYNPNIINTKAVVTGVSSGDELSEAVILGIDKTSQSIGQVDYIGLYDGINFEGDGVYRQWHYHYLRGVLLHHIGTSYASPNTQEWNTSWLPDQEQEIKVAARVVDNTGLIYFTESIDGLTLNRDYNVELCKPYDQPANWVTRKEELESKVDISRDPGEIMQAQIIWTSWSPCYSNGIYINDVKVFDSDGPCYDYMAHEITLDDISMLKKGTNVIKTGKTPLHNGEVVHGMEIQWPGIMLLIKYRQ